MPGWGRWIWAAGFWLVAQSGVVQAGQPVSLTDQRGKGVTITAPAQRVVTFNSVLWLYLTMDQGAGHVAGTSAVTRKIVADGLLAEIYPAATRIPDQVARDLVGTPNMEAILRLSPDVVFQWTGRNDDALIAPLELAGIPTIGLRQTQGEADFFSTAAMVGRVAGQDRRADWLLARYRAHYADLDLAVGPLVREPDTRQGVLYLWRASPPQPIDGSNFYSTLLERSGGRNVAAGLGKFGPVSMERILAWDPQVILLYCCDATQPADLYADPAWASVRAVRDRRVYKVPRGGSRFADIVEGPLFSRWLAELLFPSLPPRLRDDVRATIRDVYATNLDDRQTDQVLNMDANRDSVGYGRFGGKATAP